MVISIPSRSAEYQTDAELLGAFVAQGSEGAFGQLVHRHGGMVLGACRRILRQTQDAEDACQAVFLILARRARGIRNPESLSGWLHAVASRLAIKLKVKQERQRLAVQKTGQAVKVEPIFESSLVSVLDEELIHLPEKYRLPLILCYLQGRTRDEAATQLGWKVSELRGRLERGRVALRKRVEARGVTFSAAMLCLACSQVSAMPALLTVQSIRLANLTAGSAVPGHLATLTQLGMSAVPSSAKYAFLYVALAVFVGLVSLGFWPRTGEVVTTLVPSVLMMPKPMEENLPEAAIARLGTLRFRHSFWVSSFQLIPKSDLIVSTCNNWIHFWNQKSGMPAGTLQLKEAFDASQIAVSSDGKQLAVAMGDASIKVFDVASRKEVSSYSLKEFQPPRKDQFTSDDSGIGCLAFIGANQLLTVGPDTKLRVWDTRREQKLREVEVGNLEAGEFFPLPDGKKLLHATKKAPYLQIWDLETWKPVSSLAAERPISHCVFSKDWRWMATTMHSDNPELPGEVEVWDLHRGKRAEKLAGHTASVFGLAFSDDGSQLATCGYDKTIRIWDRASGKQLQKWGPLATPVYKVAFSEDGRTLYSTLAENSITDWDVASGKPIQRKEAPTHSSRTLSIAGNLLASCSRNQVYLWDIARKSLLHTFEEGTGFVAGAELVQQGKAIAVMGQDGMLRVYDTTTKAEVFVDKIGKTLDLMAICADGNTLAIWMGMSSSEEEMRKILLYDVAKRRIIRRLEIPPDREDQAQVRPSLSRIRFSADGKKLFACSGTHCHLIRWDLEAGTVLPLLYKHNGGVYDFQLSRDERTITSLGYDHQLYEWEVSSGTVRTKVDTGHASCIAVNPAGAGVAVANNAMSQIINKGEVEKQSDFASEIRLFGMRQVPVFKGHATGVSRLAFSPDGKMLFSAGMDTSIVMWDTAKYGGAVSYAFSGEKVPMEQAWENLKLADGERAWNSMKALMAEGEGAVLFLEGQLKPTGNPERKKVEELLEKLNDERAAVREKASQELQQWGDVIESDLRKELKKGGSAESKARIESLLENCTSTARLQGLRAMECLERIGTVRAKELLGKLAGGYEQHWQTVEAKGALGRMR